MAEVSVRRWKALQKLVAARCTRCGPSPSPGARLVLLAIVGRFAGGEEPPAQWAFAEELGISERTLRYHLVELRDCGFVFVQPRGREIAVYEVFAARVEAWATGGFDPSPTESRPILPDEEPGRFGRIATSVEGEEPGSFGRTDRRAPEPEPRARSNSSLSGSSFAISDVAAQVAADRLVVDAVTVLRAGGVRVPHRMKARVETWVGRGLNLDDFAIVAEKCGEMGVSAFKYAERILDEQWRGPLAPPGHEGEEVIDFEAHRDRRPFLGA